MIFQIFGVILISGWAAMIYSLLSQILARLDYLVASEEEEDGDDDPDDGEELPEETEEEQEEPVAPRRLRPAA